MSYLAAFTVTDSGLNHKTKETSAGIPEHRRLP